MAADDLNTLIRQKLAGLGDYIQRRRPAWHTTFKTEADITRRRVVIHYHVRIKPVARVPHEDYIGEVSVPEGMLDGVGSVQGYLLVGDGIIDEVEGVRAGRDD